MKTLLSVSFAVLLAAAANAAECAECICVELPLIDGSAPVTSRISDWSNGESETDRIDLLVVLDASAVRWLQNEGAEPVAEFAASEVSFLNCGLSNTGLDRYFTFRHAGTKTLAADFSGQRLQTTICNFAGTVKAGTEAKRSAVAETQAMRDAVAADAVVVLVDIGEDGPHGVSYKFTKECLSNAGMEKLSRYAYCICNIRTLGTRFTMLHELGHVFGAGHDDEQYSDPGPQLKSYSSAVRFRIGDEWHTSVMGIMASGGRTFTRWPFFSSPLYEFGDTGIVVGSEKHHDNTRTLRETYKLIANFRVAKPLPSTPDREDGDDEVPVMPEEDISLSVARVLPDGAKEALVRGASLVMTRFVNETITLESVAKNSRKVTVKVKGLPSGMKYSSKNRSISGYPKKAGSYTVKITAKASRLKTNTFSFGITVADIPSSIPGTYVGIAEIDSVPVIATLTFSTSGKTTFKAKIDGKSRTFRASGISGTTVGGARFLTRPTVKIKRVEHDLGLLIGGRSADSPDFAGTLLQSPWKRKDVSAPKISKSMTVTHEGYRFKVKSNGKVHVSGKPDGVRVSGTFQLVTDAPPAYGESAVFRLPVVFAAQKGFAGLAKTFAIRLSVNRFNKAVAAEIVSGE